VTAAAAPQWSTCRSCGASVLWAVTKRGKRIPIDAIPNPDGNLFLVDGVAHPVLSAGKGLEKFTTHFATCPHAKRWRRG
jgi:hypothetical protein